MYDLVSHTNKYPHNYAKTTKKPVSHPSHSAYSLFYPTILRPKLLFYIARYSTRYSTRSSARPSRPLSHTIKITSDADGADDGGSDACDAIDSGATLSSAITS